MIASRSRLPDITRPDASTVLVTESPAHQRVAVEELLAELEHGPWPKGLISFSAFSSNDGEMVLTYTQWASGESGHEFVAGFTDAEPIEYRLYRSQVGPDRPVPGCTVILDVEFDGPDHQRQQRWVDTVFEAMAEEAEPAPGGISGHFHVSTDGTRVLPYAEWTDEQAHRDALERSDKGMVGSASGWERVRDFPGVKSGGFRRYSMLGSLSAAPAPSEVDEIRDSPTGWVADHVRAYLESDGENGHLYQGWPSLLLTTRGRKSGVLRRTALIYGQDGDRYLVVGSNAGSPRHPGWYLNLLASPDVAVQVGSDKFTARARTATAEEKRLLWKRMTSIFPLYDTYRDQTDRDIPLVILERIIGGTE
ncbi:nitroreductase family deazaflavin-dependent oxidoreductase [Nocardia sp. KC 131]|uniref:nitroreductase family deazaflavin-dependent oxidoreductase n=1 Tax=Nocardia arseniciresistens TaxID=3392119 RepID=UPI00398E9BBD